MDLTLVGASFRPKDAKEVLASLIEGDTVYLVREADNKHDPNAIKILDGDSEDAVHIGYVARHEAAVIAPDMDEDNPDDFLVYYEAVITAKPSRYTAVLSYEGPGSDQ